MKYALWILREGTGFTQLTLDLVLLEQANYFSYLIKEVDISTRQVEYGGKRLYTTEFLHKPCSVAWFQATSIYLYYVTNRT